MNSVNVEITIISSNTVFGHVTLRQVHHVTKTRLWDDINATEKGIAFVANSKRRNNYYGKFKNI